MKNKFPCPIEKKKNDEQERATDHVFSVFSFWPTAVNLGICVGYNTKWRQDCINKKNEKKRKNNTA